MDSNLTVAETSPEGYQSVGSFSVSPCGQWAAFTTKRGRMVGASGERGHGDGGTDLLCLDLTAPGAHPFALATGASGVSKAVWTAAADGSSAAVARLDRAIVLFERLSATDPEGVLVHTLLELPEGSGAAAEGFSGSLACAGGVVVFGTSSGHEHPAHTRSFLRALSIPKALSGAVSATWLLYATEPSIGLGGWCLDPSGETVAVARSSGLAHHGDVLTLAVAPDAGGPLVVAAEGRSTYSSPLLSFGNDGALLCRLNKPLHPEEPPTADALPAAQHGLWSVSVGAETAAVPVCGDDSGNTEIVSEPSVLSTAPAANSCRSCSLLPQVDFVLSPDRTRALVAAYPHTKQTVATTLYLVDLATGETSAVPSALPEAVTHSCEAWVGGEHNAPCSGCPRVCRAPDD